MPRSANSRSPKNTERTAVKTGFSKSLKESLNEVERLGDQSDPDKVFKTIGSRLLSVNVCTLILVWNKKTRRVYLRHASLPAGLGRALDVKNQKESFQLTEDQFSRYQTVIRKKKDLFVPDRTKELLDKFAKLKKFRHKLFAANSVICPMILESEVIGFMEFLSPDISRADQKQFGNFCRSVIGNLTNSLLYQELKTSEARFRELWDHAPVAYHTLDKRGIIKDVNQTEADMLGYTKSEMLGRSIFDFVIPGQRPLAKNRFRRKISGAEVPKKDKRTYIQKNGEHIYVDIDDILEKDAQGNVIGVRTTMVDVTRRVWAEEALRTSEQRYHNLFENAPVSIIELDLFSIKSALRQLKKQGIKDLGGYLAENTDFLLQLLAQVRVKNVNSRCLRRFGARSKEELINSIHKVFQEEKLETFIDILKSIYKGRRNYKKESVIYKIRGGKENVLVSINFPGRKSGFKSVTVGIMNISQRKQAEEALRRNEEKYRSLINNALDGVLLINQEGYITFANEAFLKMSGYSAEELSTVHMSRLFHPENREEVMAKFKKRLKQQLSDTASNVLKALDKQGSVKYIEYTAAPIIEDEIVSVQVIARDITENKLLQEKVEKAKKHYEQVIDTIQESICVIDRDCHILSLNKTFSEKVGIPVKQAKGRNFKELVKTYGDQSLFGFSCRLCSKDLCNIDKAFNIGELITVESHYTEETGKTFYYLTRFFPTQDEQGRVYQVVVAIQDITEQKRSEIEVAKLSEFNQRIFDSAPVSIAVVDKEGDIIAANWLARSLLDKPKGSIIGRKLTETPEIRDNPDLAEQYEELLSKGRPLYYSNLPYHEDRTGQERYLNIIAVPLFGQDQEIDGAISMALDNTQAVLAKRKQEKLNEELERKVADRTWQLDKLNKRLLHVLELKSKFLADASHELRTPLTVIQGNLDLAIQECKWKKQEVPELYSTIMKEVEQMSGILADLSPVETMVFLSDEIRSKRFWYSRLYNLARNSFIALSRFFNCDFSSWHVTTIPVGIWVSLIAE